MTKFIEDTVSVTMTIGGQTWYLSDGKVVLSRNTAPNFVRINKMAPGPNTDFKNVNNLLGKKFSLSVDTGLTDYRNAPGEYTSTLFEGNIANITSRGTGVYKATAYDPTQQALNKTNNGGSILSQEIQLATPRAGLNEIQFGDAPYAPGTATAKMENILIKKASELLGEVLDAADVTDREIQLSPSGKTVGGPRGSFTGAQDLDLRLNQATITVGEALQKISNQTKSFWWFDRTGTFYFGVPDANVHNPELITDNSAGITTPPYQSVLIIGSKVGSEKGYGKSNQNPDEPLVVGGNIVLNEGGEPVLNEQSLQYGNVKGLVKPTFTYRSREIITEKQGKNALDKISQDLGEQYASGKLTTVGFPEPELFDVIVMPHANDDKKGKGNYNPRQPMGGSIFGLYKIEHILNSSDGYKTRLHVAGMTGPASVLVDPNQFVKDPASTFIPEDEQEDEQEGGLSGSSETRAGLVSQNTGVGL